MDGTTLIAESRQAAKAVGLRYSSDEQPGIRRRRVGKGFRYVDAGGKTMRDPAALQRIRSLAVPPAWTDVWICPDADGHLQATGRDAKGRKQYRYHADYRAARDSDKFDHILTFAVALPTIRAAVARHMAGRDLGRERVLATVVHLLESTLIRVGNEDYARQNKSYGLTTLKNPHVKVEGTALRFQFTGKSGKTWRLKISDRRVARIVRACQELPGQKLFQYLDDEGKPQSVTSSDVNAHLREIAGEDITAKDFRTWHGTVLAAMTLRDALDADDPTPTRRRLKAAIADVAARLGNTVTICRKCYIHPAIIDRYLSGDLATRLLRESPTGEHAHGLKPEEILTLALLDGRPKGKRGLKERLRQSLEAMP